MSVLTAVRTLNVTQLLLDLYFNKQLGLLVPVSCNIHSCGDKI